MRGSELHGTRPPDTTGDLTREHGIFVTGTLAAGRPRDAREAVTADTCAVRRRNRRLLGQQDEPPRR